VWRIVVGLSQCTVLVAAVKIGAVLLGVQTGKCQGKYLALRGAGGTGFWSRDPDVSKGRSALIFKGVKPYNTTVDFA